MKRVFTLLCSTLMAVGMMAADGDVTMTVSGMTTKMSDGTWSVNINSQGRVSSLKRKGTEFLGGQSIYFDYTTANGNSGLNPTNVKVIKQTTDYCEVLYSATSGNTIFEQGYITLRQLARKITFPQNNSQHFFATERAVKLLKKVEVINL